MVLERGLKKFYSDEMMRKEFTNQLLIVLLFLVLCIFSACDEKGAWDYLSSGNWIEHGFSAEKRDALRSFFENAVVTGDIPGASLLLIHKDEVIFREAFGYADLETGRPFTTENICVIASVTKPISATLMVMLEERGIFSLDDPVERWIPVFGGIKIRGGAPPDQPPILRQAISHRSGLPGNADLDDDDILLDGTLSEVVDALVEYGLLAEPGTRYAYGQAGYKTAGRVAEVATGKSFVDLLKEVLLDQLGMTRTTYHPTGEDLDSWPRVYDRTEDGFIPYQDDKIEELLNSEIDPGARLFSTLDDIGRFLLFHLNRGVVDGESLIRAESLEQMYVIPSDPPEPAYGLGWALGQGVGQIRHLGGSGTFVWVDFQQELAGVLFTQTRWKSNRVFQQRFMDMIQALFL
jgi:CubicO group peptidase (beta-lactamase class C family)